MAEDKKKASDKAKDSQTDNKHKALEAALAQIEKNYGKGAVMRLGENVGMNVDCIPTGSMTLDAALGMPAACPVAGLWRSMARRHR